MPWRRRSLTKFARHAEAYLYTLWGWMVRGAGDPLRARELVAAYPESQRLVRDLYLEELARRGRVKQLIVAAQTLQGAALGAMHLAIWGRPLAALELAATAHLHTPELVLARALACYRAGRPDLTERILTDDLPPSEVVDDTVEHALVQEPNYFRSVHGAVAHPAFSRLYFDERFEPVHSPRSGTHDAGIDTASPEFRVERGSNAIRADGARVAGGP